MFNVVKYKMLYISSNMNYWKKINNSNIFTIKAKLCFNCCLKINTDEIGIKNDISLNKCHTLNVVCAEKNKSTKYKCCKTYE